MPDQLHICVLGVLGWSECCVFCRMPEQLQICVLGVLGWSECCVFCRMPEQLKICVLGAGVIGLHAAVRLQQDFPAARVTIIAAGQGHQTTSIGAAGIFRPGVFNAVTPQMTRWVLADSTGGIRMAGRSHKSYGGTNRRI